MGSDTTTTVGNRAEQLAYRYLLQNGLALVARNFRCRGGEIDLIMLDSSCLVFVEVRFRAPNRFATAGITVDHHKQRKIIRTAAMFLTRHVRFSNHTMRFDVIAIDGLEDSGPDWIKDAFRPDSSTL
ncbi:MAG: YraN family protein [Gammaproteobacteria bacterium]|nr:YraN family protein [Gammaproteobacteria bacterium]